MTEPHTHSGWHGRMYETFAAAVATGATTAARGRLLEPVGVFAALNPEVPDRSVFNSVIYESHDALASAFGELAAAYDEAGVRAWTVWVPEADRDSARMLEEAGHNLDATPAAMVLDLDDMPAPEPGDLDWDAEATLEEVCSVNDRAYGYDAGTFARGIGNPPRDLMRFYRARLDGRTAAVTGTLDLDGDCGVYWVATLPEARGRGLITRLMHVALEEGRDRGCDISTLQATKLGQPVYEAMGYRAIGTLEMWERRKEA